MSIYITTGLFCLLAATLWANPTGGNICAGSADIAYTNSGVSVLQNSSSAIIQWDQFSIGELETVQFIQPSSQASILNRVMGDVSRIDGQLLGNGIIYLINPQGILIGPQGKIQVGNFVGSTLQLSDEDYLAGNQLLFSGDSEASLVNQGIIKTSNGNILLVARKISNQGALQAPQGSVDLVAGSEVLFQERGERAIFVRAADCSHIDNAGSILAAVAALHSSGGNLYSNAINHSGLIQATGIQEKEGKILLFAENHVVETSGQLIATQSDGTGGKVHVLGSRVHLVDSCAIDATGAQGGGEVLIGGDFQGNNSKIPNAELIWVGEETTIRADATLKGDGGKVILWSDRATFYYGKASARGGEEAGDGGFVEVSGKFLDFDGLSDTSAPCGKMGTLLLDPTNITISGVANPAGGSFSSPGPYIWTSTAITATIPATSNANSVQTLLGSNNVTINTSTQTGGPYADAGTITLAAANAISWSAATTLTLIADQSITISSNITNSGTGNFTAMNFTAKGTGSASYSGISVPAGVTLTSGQGGISLTGTGGTSTNNAGVSIAGAVTVTGNGGALSGIGITGTGTGGAATTTNAGVSIAGTVSSTGTGANGAPIVIQGTGGVGTTACVGVLVGGTVTAAAAAVNITGTGKGTAGTNYGVEITGTASSTGTGANAAPITVHGNGSTSGTATCIGVLISGGGSTVTTGDGTATVTGIAGGTTTQNYGVELAAGGTIKATGIGALNVTGTGGGLTTTNYGIFITAAGSAITSSSGTITLMGTGGGATASTSSGNNGIDLAAGGEVTSTTGNIVATGVGGSGSGSCVGINITGPSSSITTAGSVTLYGNTTAVAFPASTTLAYGASNNGVFIQLTGAVSATGTLPLTIYGCGSTSTASTGASTTNYGIIASGATLTAGSGGMALNGNGGGTPSAGGTNYGIDVITSTAISTSGPLTVTGVAGQGSSNNYGLNHATSSMTTTGSGAMIISGTPNPTSPGVGGSNIGVSMATGATLSATGAGTISVTGTGSSAGTLTNSYGIILTGQATGTQTSINTISGSITLNGTGGAGTTGCHGIEVSSGAMVGNSTGGASTSGPVMVTGVAGLGTGTCYGVYVTTTAAEITTTGTLTVNGSPSTPTAASGGSNYGIYVATTGTISTTGSGTGTTAALTLNGTGGGNASGTANYGVYLGAGTVSTVNGNVNITAISGPGTASGYGLYDNGTLTTANGAMSIIGTSTSTGATGIGVFCSGVMSATGTGSITVTATGSGGSAGTANNNYGIEIDAATVSSVGGNIHITGTGGAGTSGSNIGIYLNGTSNLVTTSTGTITLTGMSNGAATGNYGIDVGGSSTVSATGAGGSVILNGTGSSATGATTTNYGILVAGMVATTTGSITLQGTGGGLTSGNAGIEITAGTVTSSSGGSVSITGTGGSGSSANGVLVSGAAMISTTGSAPLTIMGTSPGGSGGAGGFGVSIAAGTISTASGAMQITGTPSGALASNNGLTFSASPTFSTGSGTITFTSPNISVGLLTISSSSSGQLFFEPVGYPTTSSATTVGVGSAATGNYVLVNGLLTSISGFSQITVDSLSRNTSDTVIIDTTVVLSTSITDNLTVYGNSITVSAPILGSGSSPIVVVDLIGVGSAPTLIANQVAIPYSATSTFTVTGFDVGTLMTNASGALVANFSNFQNLTNIAGTGVFNFEVSGAEISGFVTGDDAGSGSNSTLVGPDTSPPIWTITGTNTGNIPYVASFVNVGNLTGGTGGGNHFTFDSGGNLTGNLLGSNSTGIGNTVDLSAYGTSPTATVTNVNINSIVTATAGAVTGIAGTVSGIQTFDGAFFSSAAVTGNTITGPNESGIPNVWTTTSANSGTIAYGSPSTTITWNNFPNLVGGTDGNNFRFHGSGSVSTVNGGSSSGNEMDYRLYTASAITVNIPASTVSGTSFTTSFTPGTIQTFVGPNAFTTNALDGPNGTTNWIITANNAGNIDYSTYTFSNFQNLSGGSGNNYFAFDNATSIAGNLIGSTTIGTTNTLDASAYATATSVNLATDKATGIGGTFSNLQIFIGSSTATPNVFTGENLNSPAFNTWTITEATPTAGTVYDGTNTYNFTYYDDLVGGTGTNESDLLIGPPSSSQVNWTITGANDGTITGSLVEMITFSNMYNLSGGSGSNYFAFDNADSIGGNLIGSTMTGTTNTLDLSAYTTPTFVNLSNDTATGIGGTFSNIQTFIGASGSGNTFTGPSGNNTWTITAFNAGNINSGAYTFSNFPNLSGGSGNNYFAFDDLESIGGNLTGSTTIGTSNTLDLSAYYMTITNVNLTTDVATGIGGTFSNIQTFIGSDASGNTFTGPVTGSAIDTWSITGTNSGNLVNGSNTYGFTNFANLTGGAGSDGNTFEFSHIGNVTGTVTGGAGGTNTLDYNTLSYGAAIAINIGTDTAPATGGIANIQDFIGDVTYTDTNAITGPATGGFIDLWMITGTNSGTVENDGVTYGFTNFANLTGGAGADGNTFAFGPSSSVAGTVTGGAGGTNALDYSSYGAMVAVNIGAGTATATGGISNIQNFIGSTASGNTLTGPGGNNTWTITALNAGNIASGAYTFSNFPNLSGGSGNNHFTFDNGESIGGNLTGSTMTGTTNALDLSAYTTPTFINLSNSTATGIGGTFSNIQTFIGGSGSGNTFTGPSGNNTWTITAFNAGNINSGAYTFSNFPNLSGGSGNNYFAFDDLESIGGNLTGSTTIGTSNTLDLSAYYMTITNVNLTTDIATGIDGTFSNIQTFIGSSASGNTFTGPVTGSAIDTWSVTGTNRGTVVNGSNSYGFTNFANLTGGAGSDGNTFEFSHIGSVTGTVTGGAGGTNTLDYNALLFGAAIAINIGTDTAPATGGIANIQDFIGDVTYTDTNAITGPATGGFIDLWMITGTNSGTVENDGVTYGFTNFANLTGGAGADGNTFEFGPSSGVAGTVTGGAGGTNTLDYSSYGATVTVNIESGTATATGGFSNIQDFIGSTAPGNTFTGPGGNNTWTITALNAGNINSGAYTFSNFPNLSGGSGNNHFTFNDTESIGGSLVGSTTTGTTNILDLSAYTTTTNVNLTTGVATGIGGTFSNIQTFIGGSGSGNTFTGPATGSAIDTWSITGTNSGTVVNGSNTYTFTNFANLTGGTGSFGNTFAFGPSGSAAGTVTGGAGGTNTLDYSSYGAAVTVNIGAGTATATGGISNIQNFIGDSSFVNSITGPNTTNLWTITADNAGNINAIYNFTNFQNLIGGSGNDTFDFSQNFVVTSVNGSLGNNTVIGFSVDPTWDLTGPNAGTLLTGTPPGTAPAVLFTNIENLQGSGSANDYFLFNPGAAVTGTITGGGGVNTLDYSFYSYGMAVSISIASGTATGTGGIVNIQDFIGNPSHTNSFTGPNGTSYWTITGTNAGNINSNAYNFTNFQYLIGGSGNNTFDFSQGHGVSSVTGGGGVNTLIGFSAGGTWNITGLNAGNTQGIDFTNIQNLTGGAGADIFIFSNGAGVSGTINGGAPANLNVLNYDAYVTPAFITVVTPTSGLASNLGVGYTNFDKDHIIGNVIFVSPPVPPPPPPIPPIVVHARETDINVTIYQMIDYYSNIEHPYPWDYIQMNGFPLGILTAPTPNILYSEHIFDCTDSPRGKEGLRRCPVERRGGWFHLERKTSAETTKRMASR